MVTPQHCRPAAIRVEPGTIGIGTATRPATINSIPNAFRGFKGMPSQLDSSTNRLLLTETTPATVLACRSAIDFCKEFATATSMVTCPF